MKIYLLLLLCFYTINLNAGLNNCINEIKKTVNAPVVKMTPEYAKNFSVISISNIKIVTVKDSWHNSKNKFHYLLIKNKKLNKNICPEIPRFIVPIKRIVPLSTTHLPPIDMLGKSKSIVGISNSNIISTKMVIDRINSGHIKDVGYPPKTELVLSLKPDAIMAYVSETPELEGISNLIKMKLPVILNSEYREKGPLARAEWIKLIALFYDLEDKADKLFSKIRNSYINLKKKVEKTKQRPVVLSGKNMHGNWQASGGKSDFVKLLKDAGANYLWPENKSKKFITIKFEKILKLSKTAEFWLPQSFWKTKQNILIEDYRYREIEPFKSGKIFNITKKITRGGGNDYYENGMMRPDLLLADLVKIFHPELLPKHELIWYEQLR